MCSVENDESGILSLLPTPSEVEKGTGFKYVFKGHEANKHLPLVHGGGHTLLTCGLKWVSYQESWNLCFQRFSDTHQERWHWKARNPLEALRGHVAWRVPGPHSSQDN